MPSILDSINNLQKQGVDVLAQANGTDSAASTIPSPGISMLLFVILTVILFILKIVLLPSDNLKDFAETSSASKTIFIVYIVLLLVGNYLINTSVTTELCSGTPQWGTTFIITFLPWILIFGVLNIILIIFPGWLVPFSNTLGYFIVGLFGLKSLFNDKIIEEPNLYGNVQNYKINDSNIEIAKALQQIYGNESLLINEIPRVGETEVDKIKTYQDFFTTMQKLKIFRQDSEEVESAKIDLYKLLKIKDIVGEFVWYLLTGMLVCSITYNYIVNVGCDFNSKNMQNAYKSFINEQTSVE